jgi:hypothetical protein
VRGDLGRRLSRHKLSRARGLRFRLLRSPSAKPIFNQVQQVYNDLSQLITEYQSSSGAVNTSTTPKVQYAYNQMAGGANNSRLTSITYPNGRVINYNYNTGLDSTISRLSSISDSTATLESYSLSHSPKCLPL